MCKGAVRAVSTENGPGERSVGTYEWSQVLKAVSFVVVGLGKRILILQYKGDLDDPNGASSHERVPKHSVYMGTKLQALRMRTHAPSSEHYDKRGKQIPLRPSVSSS